MASPQIKLSYFDLTGRAELSRLLFTFGGIKFEDDRVADFGAFKSQCPLGQLPVLEVNGERFCQSGAIMRYAATLASLYPQDAVAALRANMVSESLAELFDKYILIRFHEKDAAVRADKFKAFAADNVAKTFAALEKMAVGPFFVGDIASFADVHLLDVVHNALEVDVSKEFSLDTYPKLHAIVKRIKENGHIAEYLGTK